MIWIKSQSDNPEVTDYYLHVIGDAYKKSGFNVGYFKNWNEIQINKDDYIVVSNHREALKMALTRKKYIYWVQGIIPEEDYAKFKKMWRKKTLELIEYYSINKAKFVIFVSKRMKSHYESKYGVRFNSNYVMPCNNDIFHDEGFQGKDKYRKNVFCYAGGLDVWQCFEETLQIYKDIEDRYNDVSLLLLVKDKKYAQNLIDKYNIKNCAIDFVPVEQLPRKLSTVKFGFLIRDDLELNRVATPTKLMTYIGNGVIPILSDCLEGLVENLEETEYLVTVNQKKELCNLDSFIKKDIDINKIHSQYKAIYDNHYNREKHITELSKVLPKPHR